MYHLVFRNAKHSQNPYYLARKTRLSSTHNQFQLDTIRGSIKSRWDLHGFGTLETQRLIWRVEEQQANNNSYMIHSHMQGHIITVDSATDVMWFRLNYENVAKNGCKLTEIYRDLDLDYIKKESTKINDLSTIAKTWSHMSSQMNNSMDWLNRYAAGYLLESEKLLSKTVETVQSQMERLKYQQETLNKKHYDALQIATKEFLEYVASKKSVIG